MPNKSDEQLMHLVMSKEHSALEELYDRYIKLVYSFAVKSSGNEQVAKDIVQLVFSRLWTTQTGYDARKGQFVNWLLTVTRNITIDYLRRERRHATAIHLENAEWDGLVDRSYHLEQMVSFTLLKEQIKQAYLFLSESQVQLIEQVYWGGYTLREISVMREEPLGTVKSRLHQSLKILRKHFATNEGEWREGMT